MSPTSDKSDKTERMQIDAKTEKQEVIDTDHADSMVMDSSHVSLNDLHQSLFGLSEAHLANVQDGSVTQENPNTQLLHQNVVADYLALQKAAKSAGFDLRIASGFRSFDRQVAIWNRKYQGLLSVFDKGGKLIDMNQCTEEEKVFAILTFSALPGLSRHHWGTDFDYYDPCLLGDSKLQLTEKEYEPDGVFGTLNQWLEDNLAEFGFFKPYRYYNQEVKGISAEPWHLSHVNQSKILFNELSKLDKGVLLAELKQHNVSGFDAIAANLDEIIQRFALTICKP